jgi:hypothetical protein
MTNDPRAFDPATEGPDRFTPPRGTPLDLIRESIASVVAGPPRREALIARALERARLPAVPHGGRALHRFVDHELRDVLEAELGEHIAGEVIGELLPIVGSAALSSARVAVTEDDAPTLTPPAASRSDVQRRSGSGSIPVIPPPPPTGFEPDLLRRAERRPTSPAPGAPPVVIVASLDRGRIAALTAALATRGSVAGVEDAAGLVDTLRDCTSYRPIVVVDCLRSAFEPAALLSIFHRLPPESQFLLWGASEELQIQIAGFRGGRWFWCRSDASLEHVASLCSAMALP